MVSGAENNPIRFYQASSSEMFGKVRETQTERTPFHLGLPMVRQGIRSTSS
jgi:GDPmannose 4,6-dehydratase